MKFIIQSVFLKWTKCVQIIDQMEQMDFNNLNEGNSFFNESSQRGNSQLNEVQPVSKDLYQEQFKNTVAKIPANPELQAKLFVKHQKHMLQLARIRLREKQEETRRQQVRLERQKEENQRKRIDAEQKRIDAEQKRIGSRVQAMKIISGMGLQDLTFEKLQQFLNKEENFPLRLKDDGVRSEGAIQGSRLGGPKEKKITKKYMKPQEHKKIQEILKNSGQSKQDLSTSLQISVRQIYNIKNKSFPADPEPPEPSE